MASRNGQCATQAPLQHLTISASLSRLFAAVWSGQTQLKVGRDLWIGTSPAWWRDYDPEHGTIREFRSPLVMTCRRAAAIAPAVQGPVGIIKDGRGFGIYDPTTDRLTLQPWPDRPLR